MENENPNLTYREAARLIGVTVGTLYSMVSRRQIPHTRLGPRLVRFPRSELARWLRARTVLADASVPGTGER